MDHSIYIYGMKFPNRLFVGGLGKSAEAKDLAEFFEKFGVVTDAKIIMNIDNSSKGYGFVTFLTANDVECVLAQGQLYFQRRKLNLGPAVRKQTPDMQGEPVLVITNSSPPATPITTSVPTQCMPRHVSIQQMPPPMASPPIYGQHYYQPVMMPLPPQARGY